MINWKTVETFLNRQLPGNDYLKKYSKEYLLAALADDVILMPHLKQMWVHQLVSYTLITTLKRYILHVEMGGGKTLTVLSSILIRKLRGEKPLAIVFVPYISSVDTWIQECQLRTPQLKLEPLLGKTHENLATLARRSADVYVICYASAVAMLSVKVPHPKKPKKFLWTIESKHVKKVFEGFDTFVADEVHKCSDINTLTYKMCKAISTNCEHGVGLSGTPFGKDIEDIWAQFYLIDFGESLGPTLGLFREAFFTKKESFWSKGSDYVFQKRKMPILNKFIKYSSIHYAASEMNDLPKQRRIIRHLKMPAAIESYTAEALRELNDSISGTGKDRFRMMESSYLKLRQLASGFMTVSSEDDKVKIAFDENPKLDLLEEIIDGMPSDSKLVVFHHFVYTNQLISEKLTKMKVGHARIWSGQKNVIGELKKFKDTAKCRVLVLNDQSGSSSLNLQHANYMMFFEQPDSPINRQQGEARIWRQGQEKVVFYVDAIMDGTVDQRIHESNKRGKKLLDELLKGKRI